MLKMTHVRLLVKDYAACFRFYRDVMGFEPTWGEEDGCYADFNAGTCALALFSRDLMAAAAGAADLPMEVACQDRSMLTFEVDDVDATWQRLCDCGVEEVAAPTDRAEWGIRAAHFRDPDGNLLEINQPLAG